MEKTEYYSGIKRYIASRISNPEDAEDLVQSVFLEFHKSNHNGENPEPYLFGIARNLIATYYHQKNKQQVFRLNSKIADDIAFSDYAGSSKTKTLVEEIENAVFGLPPKPREAVELRLMDDLSPQEAASQLDCTVERFYDRFHNGLKILKKSFAPNMMKKKRLIKKTPKNLNFFKIAIRDLPLFLPLHI